MINVSTFKNVDEEEVMKVRGEKGSEGRRREGRGRRRVRPVLMSRRKRVAATFDWLVVVLLGLDDARHTPEVPK